MGDLSRIIISQTGDFFFSGLNEIMQPSGSLNLSYGDEYCPFNGDEFRKGIIARFPYLDINVKIDRGVVAVEITEQLGSYAFNLSFSIKHGKEGSRMRSIIISGPSNNIINISDLVKAEAPVSEIVEKVAREIESHNGVQKSKRLYEMEKKMEEMQKRMEMLETAIRYMPGGSGYEEAKSHFESCI